MTDFSSVLVPNVSHTSHKSESFHKIICLLDATFTEYIHVLLASSLWKLTISLLMFPWCPANDAPDPARVYNETDVGSVKH
jgi:hypothetical protein